MEFKTIYGHNRYEISVCGIIRNAENKKIKSQYISSTGYYMVSFSYNNKTKPQKVHRLLASTYIPNPLNLPDINHIDGNKLNNSIENLEWVTHLQNMRHAFKNGLVNNTGEKNGMAKLTYSQVKEIKKLLKAGEHTQQKIASMFNISRSAILLIHLEKRWKHVI